MKYQGPMLVVKDIEKSKDFYTKILQLRKISDLGVNVTFTGGLSVQTEESWIEFTGSSKDFFTYQGNDVEFYFEEDNFDDFITRIKKEDVDFIDDVTTMPWGQRVIRFYDPDKHIIEVGENLVIMIKKFHQEGMSVDEISTKTFLDTKVIERMLKK